MVYITGLQLPVGIYSWAVTELLLTDGHCLSLQVFPAYFLGIATVSAVTGVRSTSVLGAPEKPCVSEFQSLCQLVEERPMDGILF